MPVLVKNKKAYHEYEILESFEAGMVLNGQEVKSIKERRISLKGSYVKIRNGEAYLIGANIPAYQPKNAPPDYNSERSRKLLLKKSELKYLVGKTEQKGLTIVPLKVYTKGRYLKLEIGIAKRKNKKNKREEKRRKDLEREQARELKQMGM